MKKFNRQCCIALLFVMLAGILQAQEELTFPPDPVPPLEGCESRFGFILPADSVIRTLIIFAEINYNVNPNKDPNPNSNVFWPKGSLPIWADSICDPFVPTGEPEGLLTKYYMDASSKRLYLLGDYLLDTAGGIFEIFESDILDTNGNYSNLNRVLYSKIDTVLGTNFNTANGLDTSLFDLWTKTGIYQQKITPSNDNPMKFDLVTMIWRNFIGRNNTGTAGWGGNDSLFGYCVDATINMGSYNRIPIEGLRHEFAHHLLGGNNFHSGGGWGHGDNSYWIPITAGWAALGLHNSSIMTWSGWDRQRLDWKYQNNEYNPSARNGTNTISVNGDLDATNPAHSGIYVLRDFVETGDALRIKLPYLNNTTDYPQYLWIENHNGYDKNDNPFDQFRYQSGNSCVQPCEYGLYMYLQIDRDIREGNSQEVGSGYRDYLRPVTAEGLFDRIIYDSAQNACVNSLYYLPFGRIAEFENPLSGGGDQETFAIDMGTPDQKLDHDEANLPYIEKVNSSNVFELFFNGHTRHAFTLEGNNKIGIGTNPSTGSFMNLVHYDAPPPDDIKNVRKVYLNGISIEIIEQNQNGNIKVRVRFDDVDVIENRRWCADSIVLSMPPSGADYSLNITQGANIKVDRGKTPTRITSPELIDGEYIFTDPTMFYCDRDAILHIDTASSMELINMSALQLGYGSVLVIEPGAVLTVGNNSTLLARSGSEITIKGDGKLDVADGGYICIEDGATVVLQDTTSRISLNYDYHDGVNPELGITPETDCIGMCDLEFTGSGLVVFEPPTFSGTVYIDTTLTWSGAYYTFDADLIITGKGHLTAEKGCDLVFADTCKVIVQPGGRFTIDGSSIKGVDNCLRTGWQGIEVWGNPSLSQTTSNQGWLEMVNGSHIEGADIAIRAGSEDYTGKGGGIVSAGNTTFLNNRISAWFDPYTAYNNFSAFGACTFDYTKHFNGEPDLIFVKLDQVKYLHFNNCTFTNNSNLAKTGTGIQSFNSIFFVEGDCQEYQNDTCADWAYSSFENFEYGIYATASNSTRFVDIRHTVFTDNFRGVYLGGMTLPRITSNEFYLSSPAEEEGYGLYLDGSTQYWGDDNRFEKSPSGSSQTGIGIVVNESGSLANEIYRNYFRRIEYSILVQGNNRSSRNNAIGLQLLCNRHDQTLYDETIVFDGIFIGSSHGIASKQGSDTTAVQYMAGNLFYYNTTVSGDFDDINNQSNHFFYYYSSIAGDYDVEPLDFTQSTVTIKPIPIFGWTYEECCPSNLTTGGGSEPAESWSAMNEALSNIENTESVLLALVDGGDTESLNTEVETSTPPETAEIYNELMSESPNLSETVVETSIEKEDVLPNALIRDIMVANPHTSTSLQLLEKLNDRSNPMPDNMKAQILAVRSIQSLKSELEGQIADFNLQKTRAMNRIARYFDQINENPAMTDSLIALYQTDNTASSWYMKVWMYLQNGQYAQGQNILNTIPVTFALTEDELNEYQNMQWLYTMMKELFESGNNLDDLSATQIGQLNAIVAEETGFASVYARNILLAIDESEYQEPVILPNSMKSAEAEEQYNKTLKSKEPARLEVFPNPSKDFIIIGYQFDKEIQAMIEIKDVTGRLMERIPVKGLHDQITVTTHTWPAGVYVLGLVVNDKVVETTKFTLVK